MSFSFNAAGNKASVIAEVGKQAANLEQMPQPFADSINLQLDSLPADAEVTLVCYGHTGFAADQTVGKISLHCDIDVRRDTIGQPEHEAPRGERAAQPGPERFPEGFAGDPPAGESASGAASS